MKNEEVLHQALKWLHANVKDLSQLPEPLRTEVRRVEDRPWCLTWALREAEGKSWYLKNGEDGETPRLD